MKIDSYQINMQSESKSTSFNYASVAVRSAAKTAGAVAGASKMKMSGGQSKQESQSLSSYVEDKLELSKQARDRMLRMMKMPAVSETKMSVPGGKDMFLSLLERMFGIRFKEVGVDMGQSQEQPSFSMAVTAQSASAARSSGEFVVTTTQVQYESQSTSFNAQGTVTTSDGRTIDLSVAFNMSSSFYSKMESSVTYTPPTLKDPLVINFDADFAGLSSAKFEFDIDCDGTSDQVSSLLKGSGFLAYDKSGDGKINDGSELFGALSGDGFKELAAYDQDGNGFIDEGDEIFDKLRIWLKNDDGTDTLLALGEVGVGAIYLGNVGTQYNLRNDGNLDGVLQKTGIFLREDGTAGTIQHIDLSV